MARIKRKRRHLKKYINNLVMQSGVPEEVVKQYAKTPEGKMKERRRRGGQVRPAYPALTKEEKAEVLQAQNNCCIYCGRMFGAEVHWQGRMVTLKVVWDHFKPYSKYRDNSANNSMASCQVCNNIKSDKTFQTIEEVQEFVASRWSRELERQAYQQNILASDSV